MKKKDETKTIKVRSYRNRMKSAGEEPDTYRFTASRKVTVHPDVC